MYVWNWNIVWHYKGAFAAGMATTVGLTLAVILLGTLLGAAVACAKASRIALVSWAATAYVHALRALPVLVVLVWIYYVLPLATGVRLGAFSVATIALSLHLGAFVAEALRSGVEAVPRAQFESGLALGMPPARIMASIVLPQAIRSVIPNLLGLYISEMKNTSMASIIAVDELMHRSNVLISASYRPLEIYTTMAVAYLAMILPLILLARAMERRFSRGIGIAPLFV